MRQMSLVVLLLLAVCRAAFPQSASESAKTPAFLSFSGLYEIRPQLNGALFLSGDAQRQSSVIDAFRRSAREMGDRLQLLVEAMPADRYAYRATPPQQTFGEIVGVVASRTVHLCNRITGAEPPASRV